LLPLKQGRIATATGVGVVAPEAGADCDSNGVHHKSLVTSLLITHKKQKVNIFLNILDFAN
jgi:hypothetical protein